MQTTSALPHLMEMEHATTRYLEALTELTDADVRAPSLLPAWTRGHLVTHVARNADALANLLHWAETGEVRHMYESEEQRNADIEAGSTRSASELKFDSSAACGRFLQAVNELDVAHQDALVARTPGAPMFKARTAVVLRLIELEVHHADLGIGYTAHDWDLSFAHLMLDRVMRDRADGPAMVLRATDTEGLWKYGVQGQGPWITGLACDLAWWVIGRGEGSELSSDAGVLPSLPRWR